MMMDIIFYILKSIRKTVSNPDPPGGPRGSQPACTHEAELGLS